MTAEGSGHLNRISATEAARRLSDILSRVRYRGERFEIVRGREIVAVIGPASGGRSVPLRDLDHVFETLPRLSPEEVDGFLADVEAIRREAGLPAPKWD